MSLMYKLTIKKLLDSGDSPNIFTHTNKVASWEIVRIINEVIGQKQTSGKVTADLFPPSMVSFKRTVLLLHVVYLLYLSVKLVPEVKRTTSKCI